VASRRCYFSVGDSLNIWRENLFIYLFQIRKLLLIQLCTVKFYGSAFARTKSTKPKGISWISGFNTNSITVHAVHISQVRVCATAASEALAAFRTSQRCIRFSSTGVTCFLCYHKANRPFTPGMSPRRDPYVPARLMLRPTAIKQTDCVDQSHSGLRGTAPRCVVVRVTCAKPPLPPS
jgi:hypothetical protein